MSSAASLVSLAGFLPAKQLTAKQADRLVAHLTEYTKLPQAYIDHIANTGTLPGHIETNEAGWESKPWFNAWLDKLPASKKADPFQGAVERRRVPMDPHSLANAIHPHPMLPSDAEVLAGSLALVNGNVSPDEIDLVLVASQVQDKSLPSNASLTQHKLGLKNAGAYGIDTCCSSFVTQLEIAMGLVNAGLKKKVLIVSSFIDSHVSDYSDYFSVVTGDAAVAAIVTATETNDGMLATHSSSDGARHSGIIYQRREPGLSVATATGPSLAQDFTTFYDQEACKAIARHALDDIKRVVNSCLEKAEAKVSDIDMMVTHQPVAWAPHAWREAVGVAEDKFVETFAKYGNIANCCAAANLLEALETDKVKTGDKVLICSSGAGENHIAIFLEVGEQLLNSVK